MAYQFAQEQSKIMDFLNFPNYVFVSESEQDIFKQNYYEYSPKDLIDLFKEIEKTLLPYKSEISEFYLLKDFSFSSVILKAVNIFNYSTIDDYFRKFKILEIHEVQYHIVKTLIASENDISYSEVEENVVKGIIDENKYMHFVENTSLEGSSKWHVMQWLTMTETKVLKYFDLMAQLRPLYDSFSMNYEDQVLEYGQKLIEDLNSGKKFYDITHGLVKDNLFPQGDIIISWVQPMEIAIILSEDKPYLRFGLKIETFLENMKILNENAMVERVTAFKNLGDKTRYSVLKCVASGMDSTKKIAETLGVSSATISYHLNNLLSSRLISYDSVDGKVRAQVNKEWIKQILDELKEDFLNE